MRYKLSKSNYESLPQLAKILRQDKAKKIEIEMTDNPENMPKFSEVTPFLYQILDYELFFEIWLENFPYCVMNENSIDHIIQKKDSKAEKTIKCKNCKYLKICSGFPRAYFEKYGTNEISSIPDLPIEVMLEVEPGCNFKCKFCYNKLSFAKNGRNIKGLSANYIRKIIDNVVQLGIKNFRFTGGEPLLRKDIFELINYAKKKGLYIILNTNASLVTARVAEKLKNIVDNVLIPVEDYQDKQESGITGYPDSLKKKIEAIQFLKEKNIPTVRVGTVATPNNILNFDKLAKMILKLPIDEWELYRPIPLNEESDILDSHSINILVNKIIGIKKNTEKSVYIANSLPFCAIKDLNKINYVSRGALFEDGHSRLVIDPRGFVKPHYFIDKNLGSPLDILSAWNHPFMKKIRNLDFLPRQYKRCNFAFKCKGGSRYIAKLINKSYYALDPLANYYK